MENYSFSELVDLHELHSLCEEFTQLTGFATAILDMEGTVLIGSGWREVCARFHRSTPETAARCRESDTVLAKQLGQGEKYALYRCANGLIDAAVPITIGGTQMGTLYSGQFLFEPPDQEFFRRQASDFDFDEAAYLDAVNSVPIVTEAQVRKVMGFLCRLAEMIGKMGLANKRIEGANLVIKNSPAMIFSWKTCEGRPVAFVSENIDQFGYSPEEFTSGRLNYHSILFREDLQRVVDKVAECSAQGKVRFRMEYRIVTKNGDIRWVEERTAEERDNTGRLFRYRGTVLDITERKQVEEALRFTQYAVDNASSQIFCSTAEGRIFYVNDAACRSLGYTREELAEMTISDIDPNFPPDIYTELWGELRKKGAITFETLNRHKNGSRFPVEVKVNLVVFNDKEYNYAFVSDISERKKTEETLRLIQYCVDKASIGICILSENRILSANEQMCRSLGYTRTELSAMNVFEIDPFITKKKMSELLENFRVHGYNHVETRHRRKDGTIFPVEVVTTRIVFEEKVLGVSFVQDITARKTAERALKESEERLRLALAATDQACYDLDVATGVTRLSPEFPRILGYEPGEFPPTIDFFLTQIHQEDHDRSYKAYLSAVEGRASGFTMEYRLRTKTGEWLWALSQGKVVERDKQGNALRITGILADISERKNAEERVRASLAEKTILLKEIHHRVKNNLQIISSLLDLQSDYILDDRDRSFFQDSQNRIRSMALIHQKLYKSESLALIEFHDYLEDLANHLFSSSDQNTGRIRLKVEAETVLLGMDEAIPCGLIVNELISNSLQHAFPDDREGEISISCRCKDGRIALTVEDTGIGLPPGFDFKASESLGLQLVCMLVKQLQGTIELEGDTGTSFTMRFTPPQ